MVQDTFTIKAKVWLYQGMAGWHFITVPKTTSARIKKTFGMMARGFGSLRVNATIGKTTWKTSIFWDGKLGAYVLPLKSDVRKKEHVVAGKSITLKLEIEVY